MSKPQDDPTKLAESMTKGINVLFMVGVYGAVMQGKTGHAKNLLDDANLEQLELTRLTLSRLTDLVTDAIAEKANPEETNDQELEQAVKEATQAVKKAAHRKPIMKRVK